MHGRSTGNGSCSRARGYPAGCGVYVLTSRAGDPRNEFARNPWRNHLDGDTVLACSMRIFLGDPPHDNRSQRMGRCVSHPLVPLHYPLCPARSCSVVDHASNQVRLCNACVITSACLITSRVAGHPAMQCLSNHVSNHVLITSGCGDGLDIIRLQCPATDPPTSALDLFDDDPGDVSHLLPFDGNHRVGDLANHLLFLIVGEYACDQFHLNKRHERRPLLRGDSPNRRRPNRSVEWSGELPEHSSWESIMSEPNEEPDGKI